MNPATNQQPYQPGVPPVADLLDCLNDAARNLSVLIRDANERGISVSLEKGPAGADHLFTLTYRF